MKAAGVSMYDFSVDTRRLWVKHRKNSRSKVSNKDTRVTSTLLYWRDRGMTWSKSKGNINGERISENCWNLTNCTLCIYCKKFLSANFEQISDMLFSFFIVHFELFLPTRHNYITYNSIFYRYINRLSRLFFN